MTSETELTQQTIFDKTVRHLAKLPHQSTNGNGQCRYRSPDGLACAIGCHLTDDEVAPPSGIRFIDDDGDDCVIASLDDHPINTDVDTIYQYGLLPERFYLFSDLLIIDLLIDLQRIHDHGLNWESDTGPMRLAAARRKFGAVTRKYSLDTSAIDEVFPDA